MTVDHVFNRPFMSSGGAPAAGCICGVVWICDQPKPRTKCKGPKANKGLRARKRGYR